jgi:hypothetical protein
MWVVVTENTVKTDEHIRRKNDGSILGSVLALPVHQ